MRDLANYGMRWSLQNGVLTVIANDDYLPGVAVKLNSQTGMVGFPESTQQGIEVTCLINPQIQVGNQVQIDNKDITTATIKNFYLNSIGDSVANSLYATVDQSADGQYRVIVIEHSGDTREVEWHSHLTCLRINQSPQAGAPAVFPYGPNG
jgi:baseplate hub protein gp41